MIPITLDLWWQLLAPPLKVDEETKISLLWRWNLVWHLVFDLWVQWRKEYLQSLQVHHKWKKSQRNLRVGDVVLLKDDTLVCRKLASSISRKSLSRVWWIHLCSWQTMQQSSLQLSYALVGPTNTFQSQTVLTSSGKNVLVPESNAYIKLRLHYYACTFSPHAFRYSAWSYHWYSNILSYSFFVCSFSCFFVLFFISLYMQLPHSSLTVGVAYTLIK